MSPTGYVLRLLAWGVRTRDVNEPLSTLREEMHQGFIDMRAEMRQGFIGVRTEMRQSLIEVRTEMDEGLAAVRDEMHEGLAAVRGEMRRASPTCSKASPTCSRASPSCTRAWPMSRRLDALDERVRADGVLLEALRDQVQQLAEAHAILDQRLERYRREHEIAQQEILALLRTSYQDLERRVSRLEARIGESGPAV